MANEITAQGGSASVLLTGGASAIGRAAIRQFIAAGYKVFAAVTSTDSARAVRADGAIPVYPDLMRAGEVRAAIEAASADIVVNLAPQVANHGLAAGQWNAEWIALITQGTQAIMEAATAAGVKFVVHTSPLFAGGHGESEDAAALIDAARTGEQLVLGCSTPGCVLRFGFIYGAEQSELSDLRSTLRVGRALTGVDAHAHSYWLHASDAARATLLAAQKQPAEAVIDVTDNNPASPLAFFSYFSESQGFSAPSSGGGFNLRALLSGTKPLNVAGIDVHPDAGEAGSKLGWTPQFASYRQGIDDLLLTWRAAAQGGVKI